MKSVTFIIGQLILGGAEKQLYLLVKGLHERGWKVTVITLHGGHGDYWEKPIRELGVPLCEVSTTFRLGAILKMIAFIKKNPTQIIHSWSGFTGLYALLVSLLTRISLCVGSQRSTEQNTIRELGFILYWLSYSGFKWITVNSRFGLLELQKRWPRKKLCYIPNGFDFQDTVEENEGSKKKALREEFGIPSEIVLVGAVGLMVQTKRFDLLIDSIRLVQQMGINCGLFLIGDGPLKSELHTRAGNLLERGTFFFPGFINEAQKYMPVFDIFCLTSDYEGTPNVVMEALACGLPVISTNVGDVSEIIENGETGMILPSNEPTVIAQSIHRLISDPELIDKFAKSGKQKMIREYDSNRMVDEIIDFYHKMEIGMKKENGLVS